MQLMEHLHQPPLDDVPKMLVELSWETIRAWCFVVLHVENGVSNLLFSERGREKIVFGLADLGYVSCPVLISIEIVILGRAEEIFVELCDIGFEIVLTLNLDPLMVQ